MTRLNSEFPREFLELTGGAESKSSLLGRVLYPETGILPVKRLSGAFQKVPLAPWLLFRPYLSHNLGWIENETFDNAVLRST